VSTAVGKCGNPLRRNGHVGSSTSEIKRRDDRGDDATACLWDHWLLVRHSISDPADMAFYVTFAPDTT
jgi:hypothetical protein